MKINCIAIEDEPLALQKIEGYIGQVSYLEMSGGFSNAAEAAGFIREHPVDLIFLDIRMKGMNGIQLLEVLKHRPRVIITSAYDEYALKGYELEVSDYLLKPFTFERFLKSVEKVYVELARNAGANAGFIFVKTEYRMERINLDDILYIRGMKDYLQIHTPQKRVMTLQSFKNLEKILPPGDFARVHLSWMVQISKIESIERNRILIAGETIPVSASCRESFYSLLRQKRSLL